MIDIESIMHDGNDELLYPLFTEWRKTRSLLKEEQLWTIGCGVVYTLISVL